MSVALFGLLSLIAATASGADTKAANESREFRDVMGTSEQVAAFGGDAARRASAIAKAFAAIQEVDRFFRNSKGESDLMIFEEPDSPFQAHLDHVVG